MPKRIISLDKIGTGCATKEPSMPVKNSSPSQLIQIYGTHQAT